jgi:hypothetical protein
MDDPLDGAVGIDEENPKNEVMNTKLITLCVSNIDDVIVGEDNNNNNDNTSTVVTEYSCPVCLVEYAVGDVLCVSRDRKCHHYFHRGE